MPITLPNLSIPEIKVKKLKGGLKEVTVYIKNDRLMPTHASQDLKYKITRPDFVSIKGVKVLAGMIVTDEDFNVTTEQKADPAKLKVSNIRGNSVTKVRWIVKGNSKFTVTV